MRAAIYLRISQDATGEAAGVTRQREDCIALVESQDWKLHEVYIDNDISASSGKPRPEYRRLLADIRLGLIDAVVAWHPDRLYRKLTDLEELIGAIEARNVVMRTVRAGEIDLSTPTGRMLARILSATAQAEGEIKADRWRRSWRQGREQGKVSRTGSRMFGYDHYMQVDQAEAEVARWMAAEVLTGRALESICRELEQTDIRATRGNVWTTVSLKRYLTNPRLAGWSTLKGEIVSQGQWEPILDQETFDNVTALLVHRTRPYVARVSLLNGLIFCGLCGCRLVTSASRAKRTYRCPKRPGFNGCGGVTANAAPIEEMVEGYARQRLDDDKVRVSVARLAHEPPDVQAELAALDERLRELEHQLDEPGVPVAAIVRAMDRTRERREVVMSSLSAVPRAPLPARGGPWPEDLKRRRALVDLVVERVELGPSVGGNRFKPERVTITGRGA